MKPNKKKWFMSHGKSDFAKKEGLMMKSPEEMDFKIIFRTLAFLTVLFLGIAAVLSFQTKLSPQQISLFETCSTMCQMGFGAIVGLIGGKALR